MFTYDGISTTFARDVGAAARDGRRHDADAGGGEAASSIARELGRHLVVERERRRGRRAPDRIATLSARRNDSSTAFLIHWCVVQRAADLLGHAQPAGVELARSRARRPRARPRARFCGESVGAASPTRRRSRSAATWTGSGKKRRILPSTGRSPTGSGAGQRAGRRGASSAGSMYIGICASAKNDGDLEAGLPCSADQHEAHVAVAGDEAGGERACAGRDGGTRASPRPAARD